MATNAQVRHFQTAQPFRPFLLKLADGRHFEITHPENIACSPNGREMVIFDDREMHLVEQPLVVELVAAERPASARRKTGGK
jgi:hypothetical protein